MPPDLARLNPVDEVKGVVRINPPWLQADSPAPSANVSTGARPAYDTRLASSKVAVARDHTSGSFTSSAFWYGIGSGFEHPRSSRARRHFQLITTPRIGARSTV